MMIIGRQQQQQLLNENSAPKATHCEKSAAAAIIKREIKCSFIDTDIINNSINDIFTGVVVPVKLRKDHQHHRDHDDV
jgi:hypothetical protein